MSSQFLVYAICFYLNLNLSPTSGIYSSPFQFILVQVSSTVYHIFVKWYAWNHHLSQCKLYVV